jgi:hypothetical protein
MRETIVQTLKTHYGVTECIIHERFDYLELTCVGGDSEFVCIALQQLCSTDKVKVLRNIENSYVIGVELL